MTETTKKCQYCGEEVLAVAIKCKHCGSDLIVSSLNTNGNTQQITDYGTFLLAVPFVATMLIWFWVGGMNLLQSPSSALGLILIGTILGTATLAAMEASKLSMMSDKPKGAYSPTAWFFIISLLWIVGYPVYLYQRKHYGLKNRLGFGIAVMVIFLISYTGMNESIEKQRAKVLGGFSIPE